LIGIKFEIIQVTIPGFDSPLPVNVVNLLQQWVLKLSYLNVMNGHWLSLVRWYRSHWTNQYYNCLFGK